MIKLKSTHRELCNKATSLLGSQQDIEYSIKKLKEEIEDMQSKYYEQANQRHFLVTKMNDLHFQIEKLEETKSQRQENPQEDPVTIRAAIRYSKFVYIFYLSRQKFVLQIYILSKGNMFRMDKCQVVFWLFIFRFLQCCRLLSQLMIELDFNDFHKDNYSLY